MALSSAMKAKLGLRKSKTIAKVNIPKAPKSPPAKVNLGGGR